MLDYILNAIALGIVFLYGSVGEILTEKSGHLNLGIPGIMCVGAAGGCASLHFLIMNGGFLQKFYANQFLKLPFFPAFRRLFQYSIRSFILDS